MTQPDIRRRTDGSIDIDFYRRQSEAEHRRAVNRFLRRTGRIAPALVLAAVFIAGASAMIARNTGSGPDVMAVTSKALHIPHPNATAQLGSTLTR
jgi:hypothetical protein